MILARLLRSFREHDWFTAFVELLLLIVGIFAGVQLDRWNEERLDWKRAEEYRQQLISDLQVERSYVDMLIAYHEQVRDFAMVALTAWEETPAADAVELVVALYQASNILPVVSARGAFDALSNNGLLELVGGPGLTSRLSAYYGQGLNSIFLEEKRYRTELRGVMPIAVQTRIRDDCAQVSFDERVTERLSVDCDPGLTQAQAERILADIVAYPQMRAYLRQAISRDSISIYLLNSKRDFVDVLLAELRAPDGGAGGSKGD
jgi:hypothetical protein